MRKKIDNETAAYKARFPTTIRDIQSFSRFIYDAGLYPYIPETPPIDANSKLITIGSCFSAHVADALSERGLNVTNYELSERIFTTFALREFIEGVSQGQVSDALIDDVPENRDNIQTIRKLLTEGVTVILTLGLSACWFDTETNHLVHSILPKSQEEIEALGGNRFIIERLNHLEMRQTSVEDNTSNIMSVLQTIRELNPDNQVILTVSPIPLHFCKSDQPLLTTDFLSKAVLRMAISEIEKAAPENVYYFPSFEIVRWASPHLNVHCWGSASVDGDPRHIDPGMINLVVDFFQKHYTDLA